MFIYICIILNLTLTYFGSKLCFWWVWGGNYICIAYIHSPDHNIFYFKVQFHSEHLHNMVKCPFLLQKWAWGSAKLNPVLGLNFESIQL